MEKRESAPATDSSQWAMIVHGGSDPRRDLGCSSEEQTRRRKALEAALNAGRDILEAGGRSVDAIQAAVRVLEDAPEFNAGHGAELSSQGHAELDASIMDGDGQRAGAVAGVRTIKNPVDLARCVLEHSPHVFLIGDGAEQFASRQPIARVSPDYFVTDRRMRQLLDARVQSPSEASSSNTGKMSGTVGAVARDVAGHVAAATSTGGYTNKPSGRVGDSPVIGAGTYAQDGVCAVSCTGAGEYFIRSAAAHELCARLKHGGESLAEAGESLIEEIERMGGYGGLIAVDARGHVTVAHGRSRMAYGYMRAGHPAVIVAGDHPV